MELLEKLLQNNFPVITTGGSIGLLLFMIKSFLTSDIEKIFMPRWRSVLVEGIILLFFSFVLAAMTSGLVLFDFKENIYSNIILIVIRIIFIITTIYILFNISIKFKWLKNVLKKYKMLNEIVSYLFLVSSIIIVQFELFNTKNIIFKDGNFQIEGFISSVILVGIFYFLFFGLAILNQNQIKPGYRVVILSEAKLNYLYFDEVINQNIHVYLDDFRNKNRLDSFYLYY